MKKKLLAVLAAMTTFVALSVPSLGSSAAPSTTNNIALFNDLSQPIKFVDDPSLGVGKVSDGVGKYFESYSNYKKQILSVDGAGNPVSAPYDWGFASNVSIDKTVTKSGRPSVKIVNDKPATKDLYFVNDSPTAASKGQYRSQFGTYMWLEANTTYEFNCSMITEDIKMTNPFSADVTLGARLRVRLYDAKGANEPYGSYDLTDKGKYCLDERCGNVVKNNKGDAAKGEWYTPEEPLVIKTGDTRYFAQVDVTLWGCSGTAYFNDIYAIVSGDANPYDNTPAPTEPAPTQAPPVTNSDSSSETPALNTTAGETTNTQAANSDPVSSDDVSEPEKTAGGDSSDPDESSGATSLTVPTQTEPSRGFPWAVLWVILGVAVVGGAALVVYFLKFKKKTP